ncbi:Calx-beta domain-containing protein [Bdellovibrionota bacterium FG-2]
MNKSAWSFYIIGLLSFLAGACSNGERPLVGAHISLVYEDLSSPNRSFESWNLDSPNRLLDFTCFYINITGEGITGADPLEKCSISDWPIFGTQGIGVGPFEDGQTLVVEIPSGLRRKFAVYGLYSSTGSCSDAAAGLATFDGFFLGASTIDLSQDTTVSIPIAFSTAHDPVFSCTPKDTPSIPGDLPTLSVDSVSKSEGDAGISTMVFTVTQSKISSTPTTFYWTTSDGTATAGSDYASVSLTEATIPAGKTTATLNVPLNGDTTSETDETFAVTLSSPTNATILNATGTGTITNDDSAPTLSIDSVSKFEGNTGLTTFTFTVTQNKASAVATTFNWAPSPGTALAGPDFLLTPSTQAVIPIGATTATLNVSVIGDTVGESDKTFSVTISNPTNATIANGTGTGTILNDDIWNALGNTGVTGAITQSAFYVSGDVPYFAYTTFTSGNSDLTIKKYEGSNWTSVGSTLTITGTVANLSLFVLGSTPYVAFSDATFGYPLTVKTFISSSWSDVDNTGYSTGTVTATSLSGNANNLFVAYIIGQGTAYTAGVKQISIPSGTTWTELNTTLPGSSNQGSNISLRLYGNIPYVAFGNNTGALTVEKFENASWGQVGTTPPTGVSNISLALSNTGNPFVAFQSSVTGANATVVTLNGSAWSTLGSSLSAGASAYNSLYLDSNNTPYLAFNDTVGAGQFCLKTKKHAGGTSWNTVGPECITSGAAHFGSLFANDGGTLFLGFQLMGSLNTLTALSFAP